ncbi:hypothetical protein [Rhodococcoides fascians]|uniref:hypothetical protein n=1 Tax=Rhodococcoides fascians TaxID=1828 RepID=UPI000AABFDA9|nr:MULTISPECIES: hypothetical protein [Rhodococcus]
MHSPGPIGWADLGTDGTITSKAGGVGRVRFGEQWNQVDEPEVRPPAQNANPPPPFTW